MSENNTRKFTRKTLEARYAKDPTKELCNYFSEYAIIKRKVNIEISWLKFLFERVGDRSTKNSTTCMSIILDISNGFSNDSYNRIKKLKATTNDDLKAIELFIIEELNKVGLEKPAGFVNIGCVQEDINNASTVQIIQSVLKDIWIPRATALIGQISELASQYANTPMLIHTSETQVSTTTIGKELLVYSYRLSNCLKRINYIEPTSKFNGSAGNYSSLSVAFPEKDWMQLSKTFVNYYLGLTLIPLTSQAENYDCICQIADEIRFFNNVLLDLHLTISNYIDMGYFKYRCRSEQGIIDDRSLKYQARLAVLQNNVDMSNATLVALSGKLSRFGMQKDSADYPLKKMELAFSFSLKFIMQTTKDLKCIKVDTSKISKDLNNCWEVLAEPIQTMLQKYNICNASTPLKDLMGEKDITEESIHEFINSLDMLSSKDKTILLDLTPANYATYANKIACFAYSML